MPKISFVQILLILHFLFVSVQKGLTIYNFTGCDSGHRFREKFDYFIITVLYFPHCYLYFCPLVITSYNFKMTYDYDMKRDMREICTEEKS